MADPTIEDVARALGRKAAAGNHVALAALMGMADGPEYAPLTKPIPIAVSEAVELTPIQQDRAEREAIVRHVQTGAPCGHQWLAKEPGRTWHKKRGEQPVHDCLWVGDAHAGKRHFCRCGSRLGVESGPYKHGHQTAANVEKRMAGKKAAKRIRSAPAPEADDAEPKKPRTPPGGKVVKTKTGWRVFTAEALENIKAGSRKKWAKKTASERRDQVDRMNAAKAKLRNADAVEDRSEPTPARIRAAGIDPKADNARDLFMAKMKALNEAKPLPQ